jgi:6,7-dimethyl-8-ribityllumazine synthase
MTSSDQTELPEGAQAEVAGRVGLSLEGDLDGRGLRVALAAGRFNGGITLRLVEGALEGLDACGVDRADVSVVWVPGAFELPLVARAFALAATVDAVVCLGAVIRGETSHYDFVAGECAAGLQRVQLDTGMPVVFGVLTTENVEQALARSLPDSSNKGRESAQTAVEMARLVRSGPLVGSGGPAGRRASAMI